MNSCQQSLRHFTVPFKMIEWSHHHKHEKALMVYLYLKSISNGIVDEKALDYEDIKAKLKINTKRTFNKHLNRVIQLNWIGYNKNTKRYFIRSFSNVRKQHDLQKRSGVVFEHRDFKNFKSFITASIICHDINKQEFAYKKRFIKEMGIAALKRGGALQAKNRSYLGFAPYWGMSNFALGNLLGCKKSQANRLKMKAEKDGFITTVKHWELIAELPNYDRAIREYYIEPANSYNKSDEAAKRAKIRFMSIDRDGERVIQVVKQLHDEIIPKLRFKRLNGI